MSTANAKPKPDASAFADELLSDNCVLIDWIAEELVKCRREVMADRGRELAAMLSTDGEDALRSSLRERLREKERLFPSPRYRTTERKSA